LREEKHTIKYPPAQPVTIIPIATDTLADPKTLPTTVGMVEKNPPLATPLIMTKSIKGATVFANGHNTSILSALVNRDSNSVLTGPIKSLKIPQPTRPTADAKLNPATKPAPALAERPNDTLYKGKKKGGTKRGKVAIAPARNRTRKRELRKSRLRRLVNETYSTPKMVGSNLPLNERAVVIGARSLINQAAGKPVTSITRPIIRKVHAGPSFWINPSIAKLMIVPPRPPPAYTIPLARPRFLLKY
jgi:hypothetical protein